MADDKIRMPSGQGGLTRFSDETGSKILLTPGMVVILCIFVILIVIVLHYVGTAFLP